MFDWTVPDEWNIRDAYIATPDGERVVDFRRSNLHVVSYSEPVRARMSLDELRERLHTLPDQPDLVPYRTSYYHRTWGFCLSHRQLLELAPGEYDVVIDSTLEPGKLVYGELRLQGSSDDEVLVSTYICHPSLANDNLSGIAVATMLAKQLAQRRAAALLSVPVRAGDDRTAVVAAPEPRHARSRQARPGGLVHRRRGRPHVQAQPAGEGRGRSRCRARAPGLRAPRIVFSTGSHGAATSASSAPRDSICRSAA